MQHEPNEGAAPPLRRRYEVDGRRLFLHRSGTGGPAVVFLPGAGAVGLDYLNVHQRVAELTTSVIYDRGGTGWSDPLPLPRTAAETATELRDLLRAAEIPGPYVLAAHSLGGTHARRFSQLFPDEVAGLLWLEGLHEDWDAHMPESMRLANSTQPLPDLDEQQLQQFRAYFSQMFATWPDELRELLVERHLSTEWLHSNNHQRSNVPDLAAEIRAGGGGPDVPLIALTGVGIDPGQALFMSDEELRELNESKQKLFQTFADSVTRGEHRVLEGAGHSTLHTDRPDAVVEAVRDLLSRLR
ncbi:alpha/beta fold hydrolase [Saccharopolyspora sp. 5N102]|uniref:alpha/beta fold hydrolase n=1 Tax=Saccharopolyspora sp. 5N102 TaxID=3375155 RepID=UPI00379BC6AA